MERFSLWEEAGRGRLGALLKGKPIRLLSCEAEKEIVKPPAQYLADHLQVRVMAPTDILYIYPDGEMVVGENGKGYWRIFEPQEKGVGK